MVGRAGGRVDRRVDPRCIVPAASGQTFHRPSVAPSSAAASLLSVSLVALEVRARRTVSLCGVRRAGMP